MVRETADALKRSIDTLEETYEFMLAYAAQGLDSDAASGSGSKLRELLHNSDEALGCLPTLAAAAAPAPDDPAYGDFIGVLGRDAHASRAAIRLVLAVPAISSQLIDNLNASIHLRALLTDLFLLDELLTARRQATP